MTTEKLIEAALVIGTAILILVVGLIVIKITTKILYKALEKTKLDEALYKFIGSTVKIVLFVILIITVLACLKVPVSSFVVGLGAAGAAVALAIKDSLGNVAGGIIILVTKPFKSNDYIEIGQVSGLVQNIDLLTTSLRTFDNKIVRIPNAQITTSVLTNYTEQDKRRVDCVFSISYHDSIAEAKELLLNVAKEHDRIFNDPVPLIGVAGHGPSSIDIDMKVWCTTEDYWDVKYFLEENVKIAFDEAGITIPYPQMDVHMKRVR